MQQNPPDRERPEGHIPNLGQTAPANSPYTNDEWLALVELPVKVGRAMMAVSPTGAIGMAQEIIALRKAYQEAFQTTNNPILLNMRQHLQSQDSIERIWEDAGHAFHDRWDTANVYQTAIAACQQAVALVRKLSTQEALEYKDFIYTTALKVAQAAREGGFMGIGGVAIVAEERSLLNDIARALGLQYS